jgi:WD40 repeat protein
MSGPAIDPTRTRLAFELRHTTPLFSCRIDPTGRYVFAGAQDFGIQRWELAANATKTTLAGHRSWIRALAFHPTERKLLSGDYHGKVLFWSYDAATPEPERTVDAHQGWCRAVAIAPDGRSFATCGNDNLVKLWSYPDARLIRTFEGHDSHVYNVAFHPSGRHLVSGDLHGNLKQWDVERGNQVRTFDASILFRYDPTFRADHGGIRSMAFQADGAVFAVTGITNVSNAFAGIGNPAVLLFDWQTGQRRQVLRPAAAFQGTGWGVVFHPDNFVIAAAGGSGGSLFFWRPDREQSVHTLALPNNARDLALHPEGRRLAIPFFDGQVRVYDLLPAA